MSGANAVLQTLAQLLDSLSGVSVEATVIADELRERWWTPAGRQLASEVFRFLRGERPLPPEIDFHEGLADLRGVGVPPPHPPQYLDGKVDYGPLGGPNFQVKNVHWDQLDLSHAWLPRLRASGIAITECRFDRANCRYWRLEMASVADSSFVDADFWRASLMGWNQSEGNVWTGCIFDHAKMKSLDLRGGQLLGCTFEQTQLDGSIFTQVDVRNCVFSGSVRRVVFDGRRTPGYPAAPAMRGVDLSDAVLDGSKFLGYLFSRVELPPDLDVIERYPAAVADAVNQISELDGSRSPLSPTCSVLSWRWTLIRTLLECSTAVSTERRAARSW